MIRCVIWCVLDVCLFFCHESPLHQQTSHCRVVYSLFTHTHTFLLNLWCAWKYPWIGMSQYPDYPKDYYSWYSDDWYITVLYHYRYKLHLKSVSACWASTLSCDCQTNIIQSTRSFLINPLICLTASFSQEI